MASRVRIVLSACLAALIAAGPLYILAFATTADRLEKKAPSDIAFCAALGQGDAAQAVSGRHARRSVPRPAVASPSFAADDAVATAGFATLISSSRQFRGVRSPSLVLFPDRLLI